MQLSRYAVYNLYNLWYTADYSILHYALVWPHLKEGRHHTLNLGIVDQVAQVMQSHSSLVFKARNQITIKMRAIFTIKQPDDIRKLHMIPLCGSQLYI